MLKELIGILQAKKLALQAITFAIDKVNVDLGACSTQSDFNDDCKNIMILAEAFEKIKRS